MPSVMHMKLSIGYEERDRNRKMILVSSEFWEERVEMREVSRDSFIGLNMYESRVIAKISVDIMDSHKEHLPYLSL